MRWCIFATFLLTIIIYNVESVKITPGKVCLKCCGKPPCCHCCGLPGCGTEFESITSERIRSDLTVEPIIDKRSSRVPVTKFSLPPMCLMCCGKPPCCSTCGLEINP